MAVAGLEEFKKYELLVSAYSDLGEGPSAQLSLSTNGKLLLQPFSAKINLTRRHYQFLIRL